MGALSCCECRRKEKDFFNQFIQRAYSPPQSTTAQDQVESSNSKSTQYLELLYSLGSASKHERTLAISLKKKRITRFLKSLERAEDVLIKKQIVVPSMLIDYPSDPELSLLILQSPVSLRKFQLLHRLNHRAVLQNFEERGLTLIGESIEQRQLQLINDLDNHYIFFGLELLGVTRQSENQYNLLFYKQPPVFRRSISNYTVEVHKGNIDDKGLSELVNEKWKREKAILKGTLTTHKQNSNEVDEHYFIFKKIMRTYRAKRIEISGFVVEYIPEEFIKEGDIALTRKLTNQEVISQMHPFGMVVNTNIEDSLLIYSID